ncbi:MAG: GTPase HflX [Spirochaetia bacterium]|nr:GTPase HflX [Spirochaetia bacterium]
MDASSLIQHKLTISSSGEYRALLIGQYGSKYYPNKEIQEESLRELYLLSDTAGISQMNDLFFHVSTPDSGTFFSKGILEKIQEMIKENNYNILIADVNLKPAQLKNLEELLKIRVLGRIELILDIFAMRAVTHESALQVELAQLTYILPRLKGLGGVLSRLGGGIGTRGPGESMLETDRRHINKRIQKIKEELKSVSKHRDNTRKNRNIMTYALVGYTNAGKTSLLNQLCSSAKKLFAEDRLFATLDSFSRKVYLGEINNKPFYSVITDTVGFIRNLPPSLSAAFQSTLEEISYTDAIILVIDASSLRLDEEIEIVHNELEKLKVNEKQKIIFFNKSDLIFPSLKRKLSKKYPNAVWGNALSKDGTKDLRKKLFELTKKSFFLHETR